MRDSNLGLTLFAVVVYLFLLGPLVIMVGTAFTSQTYLTFPPQGFSLRWFPRVFEISTFAEGFRVSVLIALQATGLALLLGIPAAYALSRYVFKNRSWLYTFFTSPVLIPGVVLGFALFRFLVSQYRIQVEWALLLGHTIILIPYAIRVISSSLVNLDVEIEEAAMSLGANRVLTFFKVVMPNIKSGMIAAFILMFLDSFNNVPVSVFLTGPGVGTLPINMFSYVEYNFDPTVSALSVMFMAATAVLMFIVERTLGLGYFAK